MGCWNETCMVSNLPIMQGDTIGAVLVVKRGDLARTSYPDQIWTPITPVIWGEYNGYGNMDVFDVYKPTSPLAFINRKLTEVLKNLPETNFMEYDNWGNPLASTIQGDSFTLEYLVAAAADESLRVSFPNQSKEQTITAPVSVVFIKREMIDFIYSATDREGTEYREFQGNLFVSILRDSLNHYILRNLHTSGVSVESVYRLNSWLRKTRHQWMPSSGVGNQRGVESRQEVEFHELIASLARDYYAEYESAVF